jgi:hypothetical protein
MTVCRRLRPGADVALERPAFLRFFEAGFPAAGQIPGAEAGQANHQLSV